MKACFNPDENSDGNVREKFLAFFILFLIKIYIRKCGLWK